MNDTEIPAAAPFMVDAWFSKCKKCGPLVVVVLCLHPYAGWVSVTCGTLLG